VVTLAQVIGTGVDNKSTTKNTFGANQLDEAVLNLTDGITLSISLVVAEVTNVPLLGIGSAMVGLEGIEVRAGAGAAVGVVTELVDVHATLSIGVIALDVVFDDGVRGLGLLGESHGTRDIGVSTENGDSFDHFDLV